MDERSLTDCNMPRPPRFIRLAAASAAASFVELEGVADHLRADVLAQSGELARAQRLLFAFRLGVVGLRLPVEQAPERQSVVEGKSVSVSVELGGCRIMKK